MQHMLALPCLAVFSGLLATIGVARGASDLEVMQNGFAGALRGCEAWVLEPSSWIDGFDPFVAAIGMGDRLRQVEDVPDQLLPPAIARRANWYWRIDIDESAGYSLVVSDQVPMCHIAGADELDLRPVVRTVLASADIEKRWELLGEEYRDGVTSTLLRLREDQRATLLVSRTDRLGQWDERPQILATLSYALER